MLETIECRRMSTHAALVGADSHNYNQRPDTFKSRRIAVSRRVGRTADSQCAKNRKHRRHSRAFSIFRAALLARRCLRGVDKSDDLERQIQ